VSAHEDIAKQRPAEILPPEGEPVLQSAFDHMNEGIGVYDASLNMVATNFRFRQLLDLPEALCRAGAPLAGLIRHEAERGEYGPGDVEEQLRARLDLARRAEPQLVERELADGTILEIRGTALPDGGFMTICTDITGRARVERELRAAHARLRDALEVIPEGLALFDAADRLVLWNKHYEEIYAENTEHIHIGAKFEDALRIGLAQGHYGDALGREEAWLAERMALHAAANSSHDQHLPGDRWVRIEERRTADGGSVGVRIDITDLKRREATFKLLFDGNPVPMLVYDTENLGFLAVNDAALEYYGYGREQFLSLTILDIRPPEDRERFAATAKNFESQRTTVSARHVKSDGSIIKVDVYSNELIYRDREARFAAMIDVTVRERADEERERSRAFLEQIIDTVPVSITVKESNELRFVMLNRTAEQFWGVSRTEAIGKTVRDLFGNELAELVTARDHAALEADGPVYIGEHRRVGRGNDDRIFVSTRVAVRDTDGKPTYVVGVMEDVTERKRAENELSRTRAFLDTVIENVPAMLFVKEPLEHRYAFINRAGERLLGVSRDELIGKNDYDLLPQEEADISFARDREILCSEEHQEVVEEGPIETPHNGIRLVTTKRLAILDQNKQPQYLLGVTEDITERKRAEERIEHLAHFDGLTDLPNRSAFTARLAAAIADANKDGGSFALLFLDLDRFKEVNDVFGHAAGDCLLMEVAKRLEAAAEGAFVARLGGDEFTLIVEGPQPTMAAALTDRVIAMLAEEIVVENQRLQTGVSVGVAIFPADGTDTATLLGNADAALYRAKAQGRGSIRYFEAEMDMQLRERRALQHDLRSALAAGQISLHYQPQVKVGGVTTGFEGLLRWDHPTRGMVSPADFIPVAEESGLIIELGEWVLREACREAASWPNPLHIAVNLSPMQFRHGDLPALVHSALLESGLAAGRLELEITEGVLIDDFSRALSILRRLKSLGVRIAMDDFGTGYSSLSYLQSFPFDKIKIDQTFISNLESNPQSAAIVRAVIGLARGLDMPVVAEGVETADQLDFLTREHCDEVQGYLIGRPKPIHHYDEIIGLRAGSERARGSSAS
jgi:diguanylate cyclase (GGDEF)-like protein/PAS domain S-box-containing protein